MSEAAVIKVLVADDHAMVREGIRSVLEREAGFQVVAEASNGSEVVPLAERQRPDVAILDISMPGETGLKAALQLRQALPEVRVLILSMYDNTEYVLESVRAGAHGYLLKDGAAQELAAAIRTVLDTVRAWAGAWTAQDVDKYLSFYARDFRTPKGEARGKWEAERRKQIRSPRVVTVDVIDPKVTITDPSHATVAFKQNYRADAYRSSGRKTLVLVRQGERWLIQQEAITFR